jgi:uncharacterized Zn finger protein (UPF0148 family)
VIDGWLSEEDCPDCGGPLLETGDCAHVLTLECPECAYRVTWQTTDTSDREAE